MSHLLTRRRSADHAASAVRTAALQFALDREVYYNKLPVGSIEVDLYEVIPVKPYKLFDAEYKFVSLIWENEPVNSTELVRLSLDRLGWKKSTTYTVLRKLCRRGILQNRDSIVTSLVKREDVQKYESEALVEKNFDGSLPMFLTAFLDEKKLSTKEAEELKQIIEKAAR